MFHIRGHQLHRIEAIRKRQRSFGIDATATTLAQLFAAVHESGCGTEAKSANVCFCAACGGKPDIRQTSRNHAAGPEPDIATVTLGTWA